MDFQINNKIFCYGYGYQWHLLIATPLMVLFYWYDDITKDIKNNTLNYNLSFKLTMITRALLVSHYPVLIFSNAVTLIDRLPQIFFFLNESLSFIPINYFSPFQQLDSDWTKTVV